jgi:hypothetical protein
MSRDIVDSCRETSWTIGCAEGLVGAAGVEGEVAEELAVGGEDSYVAVGYEHQHACALVTAADGHVVEAAAVAEGDVAGVDLVLADPAVGDDRERRVGGLGLQRSACTCRRG